MIVTRLPWMAQRLVSGVSYKDKCTQTFKQRDKVCLNGFLESTNGRRLESEIRLEILGDFADETLERELADQELSGLLVSSDFTKRDRTRAITMGLFDTSRSED